MLTGDKDQIRRDRQALVEAIESAGSKVQGIVHSTTTKPPRHRCIRATMALGVLSVMRRAANSAETFSTCRLGPRIGLSATC
jgi:hypothetical protein